MIKRRTLIPTFFAAALIALALPAMASAQGSYDPYGGYGRDTNNRRNDDYRYGRYDQRGVRDSVKRVKNRSDDFQDHLDSALDHSRYDDSRREDRINEVAKEFHRAANNLDDHFDNGRNLSRSSNDARRLLQLGTRIDRLMSLNRFDGRAESDWARIRQDLRVIASAYGFNLADFDDGNYRRDDNYRRGSNRRTSFPW